MKILTAILTCSGNQKRADACLDTWIKSIKDPHDYVFYGDKAQSEKMDKTWDCTPDGGECRSRLPEKTYKMLEKSLEHEWDFLFKCDDDTYVAHNKLVKLIDKYNPLEDLYIGYPIRSVGWTYAQGGAGYLLTRTAVKKCLNSFKSLKIAEDYSVGKALLEEGVTLNGTKLLHTPCPNNAKKNQSICVDAIVKHNKITTHYVKPNTMENIYDIFKK